jgi:hypothetical protein
VFRGCSIAKTACRRQWLIVAPVFRLLLRTTFYSEREKATAAVLKKKRG